MSMSSLPPNLRVRLARLQGDPEFLELLRAIPAPYLPRYKPSRSEGGSSDGDHMQQMHDWVFASGKREGHLLLLSYLGVKPEALERNET